MKELKKFKQEGNIYSLKMTQSATYVLVIFGLLLFYIAFFVLDSADKTLKYSTVIIGLLVIFAGYLRFGAKFIIDKNTGKILIKRNAISKEMEFNIKDFSRFHVEKIISLGFITTNVSGSIHFLKDGKEKGFLMVQTFLFSRPVQEVIDEAASILDIPNE